MKSTVVSDAPTSTTNITGFLATCRGASLRKLVAATRRRTIVRDRTSDS